ncbi:hypothetical protein FACS189445_1380 [Spirochaetia bacterium]|nr:hypothetical protein FACS189445_1380 [Spirochaetia bacterium]
MPPELTVENIKSIILFVAPGFISLKVWGLIHSNLRFRISESLIEAVIYSSWNAVFFLGVFEVLNKVNPILAYAVIFICLPVIWPILFNLVAKIPYLRARLTPTSWDHVFNEREDCFILLHMKNGQMLGGLYSGNSFASSYPEKKDLYLSQLWKIDEEGAFKEKVENSGGLLVNFEEVTYIEIFNLEFKPVATIEPSQVAAK